MVRFIALVTAFTLLLLNIAFAQEKPNIVKAFSESYSYENSADYTKAIESIKKVYAADSYEMNLRLGWLYYLAKDYKDSETYYTKAITIMPLSIEARLGYAYPAYALGNKEAVIRKYKEIITVDPYNYYANYRLGALYYEMGDFINAKKHLDKVINYYPFDYDGIIMSAWTNYRLNKLREAKVLFNKALLNRPNDASALEGLSLIK